MTKSGDFLRCYDFQSLPPPYPPCRILFPSQMKTRFGWDVWTIFFWLGKEKNIKVSPKTTYDKILLTNPTLQWEPNIVVCPTRSVPWCSDLKHDHQLSIDWKKIRNRPCIPADNSFGVSCPTGNCIVAVNNVQAVHFTPPQRRRCDELESRIQLFS